MGYFVDKSFMIIESYLQAVPLLADNWMRLELQIVVAIFFDLLFGDPAWLPHPVTGVARLANVLETFSRRALPWPRLAGVLLTLIVVVVSVGLVWLLIYTAEQLHPLASDVLSILILYSCFASRGLAEHAQKVYDSLIGGDLSAARSNASLLVGRETGGMDEGEVVRATVESVAENTNDGVMAPLLYASILGPLGAVAYKTVNTLDSIFGYKNEQYLNFGWAPARLDDLLNIIPARISAFLIICTAPFLGLPLKRSFRVYARDRSRHPSPNSGHPEAAMAGALGVQLGGTNFYPKRVEHRPFLGDAIEPLSAEHIKYATRLMWVSFCIATMLSLSVRWLISEYWEIMKW